MYLMLDNITILRELLRHEGVHTRCDTMMRSLLVVVVSSSHQ